MPNSIIELGGAFANCQNLKSIRLSQSLTIIDAWTFKDCTNLESIEIPDSIVVLKYGAFGNCSSLKNIKLPPKLVEIEYWAFQNCYSLSEIEIPGTVEKIGQQSFFCCQALTNVIFCDSDTPIELTIEDEYYGNKAPSFDGCKLKELYMGREIVNHEALCLSEDLEKISFGRNVEIVPKDMFESSANILEISSYRLTPPVLDSGCGFSNKTYMNAIVNIPVGTLDLYLSTDYWKSFWNLNEVDFGEASIKNIKLDDQSLVINSRSILNPKNNLILIYDYTGKKVYNGTDEIISLPFPDLYIIKVNSRTTKLWIK